MEFALIELFWNLLRRILSLPNYKETGFAQFVLRPADFVYKKRFIIEFNIHAMRVFVIVSIPNAAHMDVLNWAVDQNDFLIVVVVCFYTQYVICDGFSPHPIAEKEKS